MAHTDIHEDAQVRERRHDPRHDGDHSLVDLIKDLRDETTHLFRQEVALAKTEMSEKISRVGRNTGYMGVGLALTTASILFFALAVTVGIYNGLVAAGLSHAASGWIAPLIVGLITAAIGFALVQKGKSALQNESPVPERTVDTMQDNKHWIKEKVKR